jgi:hypothetical protein
MEAMDQLIFYTRKEHELYSEKIKGIDDVNNPLVYETLGKIDRWRGILGDYDNERFNYRDQNFDSVNEALLVYPNERRKILYAKFTQVPIASKVLLLTNDAQLMGSQENKFPIRDLELEQVRDELLMDTDLRILKKLSKALKK